MPSFKSIDSLIAHLLICEFYTQRDLQLSSEYQYFKLIFATANNSAESIWEVIFPTLGVFVPQINTEQSYSSGRRDHAYTIETENVWLKHDKLSGY